jgi:hypothetical protein
VTTFSTVSRARPAGAPGRSGPGRFARDRDVLSGFVKRTEGHSPRAWQDERRGSSPQGGVPGFAGQTLDSDLFADRPRHLSGGLGESEALDRLDVCARQAQLDAVSTTSRRAAYVQHPAAWNGHERFRRGIRRSGNAISDRGEFAGDRPVAWSKCGGQGRGRTADLPLFRRTLVPTELPDLGWARGRRPEPSPGAADPSGPDGI